MPSPLVRPLVARPVPRRAGTAALALLGLAALAAGCAPATSPSDVPTPPAAEGLAAQAPADLSTIDNCGVEVAVGDPPQRVVAIKSSSFELMLALGLADRVVGAAFLDGPVPEEYATAAAGVPVISDGAPGGEAVLALEPDMVFAGWESNFAADSAGERSTLGGLGILTYVSPAACKAEPYKPDPLTFDHVFADIVEAGQIFGVPEDAEALVAEQRADLAALQPDDRGLTALWYSSGTDVPYVGAGIGAPQMIMDAIGLTNVAAGVRDTWTSFGWEQVADADPDVIVLVDATWNSAQQKIALLEANPVASRLPAVREQRYLVVPFPATEAGVRNVAAARDLSAQLAATDVAP